MGAGITKSWNWELRSAREELWPILSDTARINEALGLPPYRLRERSDDLGQSRRFGSSNAGGASPDWEEPLFQWAAPHWWRWERFYGDGPFVSANGALVLDRNPKGGTKASYTLEVEPRGASGRMLITFGHLTQAARGLEKIARQADAHCRNGRGEFFSNLSAARSTAKKRKPPKAALNEDEAFRAWAKVAPAEDSAGLRPRRLARALGMDLHQMLTMLDRARRETLVKMRFRMLCAVCGTSLREAELPRELPHDGSCACGAEVHRDFSQMEALFSLGPELHERSDGVHCASGPQTLERALACQTLEARERRDLEVPLPAGLYRPRIVGGAIGEPFESDGNGALIRVGEGEISAELSGSMLSFENYAARDATVVVESLRAPPDRLSVAELLSHQVWFQRLRAIDLGVRRGDAAGEACVLALVFNAIENAEQLLARIALGHQGSLAGSGATDALLLFETEDSAVAALTEARSALPACVGAYSFGPIQLRPGEGTVRLMGPTVEAAQERATDLFLRDS